MGSIRTALGIITLIADAIAVFQIIRKAVLRCVASYKRTRRLVSPSPIRRAAAA